MPSCKQRRTNVTKACTNCQRKHIKCTGKATCEHCAERNFECIFIDS
ncbi:15260_t:CDS:1, partial [Gigaspora rosea]